MCKNYHLKKTYNVDQSVENSFLSNVSYQYKKKKNDDNDVDLREIAQGKFKPELPEI